MLRVLLEWVVTAGAVASIIYYLTATFCGWSYFRRPSKYAPVFLPPVSILKPVYGLDRAAYANFARLCQQNYPEYEILFCVNDSADPAIPHIQRLMQAFPKRPIRLLVGSIYRGSNDKVRKLCRLAEEARYQILVISDSDIRVTPDYLRSVAAPFKDPQVGAVTCMYQMKADKKLGHEMEAIGLASEFLPGVLVARWVEGMKFTLGATVAVRANHLKEMGGFEAIVDCLSDDYELGRRIAQNGHRVELIPYTVWTLAPSEGMLAFVTHQLRWAVGIRHSRPWGYLGRLLTQGLPWSLAAVAVYHHWLAAEIFPGSYLVARFAMAWTVGVWGLKDPLVRKKWWLIPLWDALAFFFWAASLTRRRVHWRGSDFYVRDGRLIPVASED